jgi:hypothetical protein
MYIGLLNKQFLCNPGEGIPRSARPMFVFVVRYSWLQSYFGGWGHVPHERVVARRVRPDQRWDAGVGARDGQPGSNAMTGRSLAVDRPCACRAFPGIEARHDTYRWLVASGAAAKRGGGNPYDQPPPESLVRKLEIMSVPGVEVTTLPYPADLP